MSLDDNILENIISPQYIAGFLDGEGWFSIKKSAGKISPSYQITVGASNTDITVIKMIMSLYGGSINIRKKRKINWKNEFSYSIHCREAEKLIISVLPYLIIKKERAAICLELMNGIVQSHGIKLSDDVINYREKLFLKIKELNKKGV